MKRLFYLLISVLLISFFSCIKNGDPVAPLINGQTSYTFSAFSPNPTLQAGGTVTGTAGTTVTVRIVANTAVGNGYDLDFVISGANYTYNSSNQSTNALVLHQPGNSAHNSVYATFVMPSSGSITWNGYFLGDTNGNSATITVSNSTK